MDDLLTNWPADGVARYGGEAVRFKNRLAETGLFSDEALAGLL